MKKLTTLTIVLLLLVAAVPVMAAPGPLVVDDDGQECSDPDFSTIQEAIDAADPGDQIKVCAGTYFGATVNKAVHLWAKGDVVINDGPNSHSFLRAGFLFADDYSGSGASIKGFRFEGVQQSGYTDDGSLDFPIFSRGANNVSVKNNVMVNSLQGVTNWNGSGWKIMGNKITDLWTLNGGGIGILAGGNDGAGPHSGNVIANNKIGGTLQVFADDGGGYDGTGIVLFADFRWTPGATAVRSNVITKNEICLLSDNPSVVNVNGIELTDTREDPDPKVVFNNKVSDNKINCIGRNGIAVTGAQANRFTGNRLGDSGEFDIYDDTTGSYTAGTANWWKKNACDTSSPAGICGD